MSSSIDPPSIDPLPILLSACQGERRVIYGIAAEPGSGKTTLSRSLVSQCNKLFPNTCVTLSMDGFHLYRSQLSQGVNGRSPEECHRRRGAPWTFDPTAMCALLERIKATTTTTIGWPDFDHAKKDPEEDAIKVDPGVKVVLLEGLYLLHRKDGWERLEGLLEQTWYLATPPALCASRLLGRHMAAWGLTAAEAQARIDENDGINALLVRSTMPTAAGLVHSEERERGEE